MDQGQCEDTFKLYIRLMVAFWNIQDVATELSMVNPDDPNIRQMINESLPQMRDISRMLWEIFRPLFDKPNGS